MNKLLKCLAIAGVVFTTQAANAQFVVKVRPVAPRIVRVVAPGPRYVWIDEDWGWRGNGYVYNGGRWAAPPAGFVRWVPGHWKDSRRHGWIWKPGHWV